MVQFRHRGTGACLHSHGGHPSPATGQQEVTGFGDADGNNNWRVEFEGDRFRIIHCETDHAVRPPLSRLGLARRALLTSQASPGSRYRCSRST